MKLNKSPVAWLLRIVLTVAALWLVWHYWPAKKVESIQIADGSQIKFHTKGDRIEIYENQHWVPFFVKGVNIGAALPGHDPGELPISTFGGLKARGHALGATGVYQAAEVVMQLRGQAGNNQIENVRQGMTLNLGGLGSTAVAHILERVD